MMQPELELELESDHGGDIDWVYEDLTWHKVDHHEITRAIAKLSLPSTAMFKGSTFIVSKYFDNYYSVEYDQPNATAA